MLIDPALHGAAEALDNLSHLGRGPEFLGQRGTPDGGASMSRTLRHGAALRTIVGRIVRALLEEVAVGLASQAIFTLGPTPAMSQIIEESVCLLQDAASHVSFSSAPREVLGHGTLGPLGWYVRRFAVMAVVTIQLRGGFAEMLAQTLRRLLQLGGAVRRDSERGSASADGGAAAGLLPIVVHRLLLLLHLVNVVDACCGGRWKIGK